ncbi:hypothetical protein WDW86_10140 [Bdellovibrionota bacterium FG-2]
MKYNKLFLFGAAVLVLGQAACSFKLPHGADSSSSLVPSVPSPESSPLLDGQSPSDGAKTDVPDDGSGSSGTGGSSADNGNAPSPSAALLVTDWVVEAHLSKGVDVLTKTLSDEKLATFRKQFKVPSLLQLSLPESNGFEVYQIHGYPELETTLLIHPKVFIRSAVEGGSILGHYTGIKDGGGNELIEISVPVALVDGLVPLVPTPGGPAEGALAAVKLSSKYQIQDVEALKAKSGSKALRAMPACPSLFRLQYQGREYWAKSPFTGHSACPVNRFFRISFRAPVKTMKRLLEAASLGDEIVTIQADFDMSFTVPRTLYEASVNAKAFKEQLRVNLADVEIVDRDIAFRPAYTLPDLEAVIQKSVFGAIAATGMSPEASRDLPGLVDFIMASYFNEPFPCRGGGICRTKQTFSYQSESIHYNWEDLETIAAGIKTQAIVGVGAVANSSQFIAKPTVDALAQIKRPVYFRDMPIREVASACRDLEKIDYATLPQGSPETLEYTKSYCTQIMENFTPSKEVENDGYYPLGSHTTVFPGAILRIDLDEIAELTTAKTKVRSDGIEEVESQVVDLMSGTPDQRTACVEGHAAACSKYKSHPEPVLGLEGQLLYDRKPCPKGEAGCTCEKSEGSEEVCTHLIPQSQMALDFECEAKDEIEFCPYWTTRDVEVGRHQEQKCESKTNGGFGILFGLIYSGPSESRTCEITKDEPILVKNRILNCKEDNPEGPVHRVKYCKHPKYYCEAWATNCTHYSVNEAFHIIHEEITPRWRPFAINKGEYPKKLEEQLFLKFVSPNPKGGTKIVTDCPLIEFPHEFRGNTMFIKMPTEAGEVPNCLIFDAENSKPYYLPKVWLKNAISYPEQRRCGKTEYSFLTEAVSLTGRSDLVPPEFSNKTKVNIGPVAGSCRWENPFRVGSDLWFTEYPPVQIKGRVAVLGRTFESVISDGQ